MASELKPCPFCGGTDVNLHHSAKTFMSWISCKSCGLDAPSETGVTDEEAITYWNTRPAPAATDTGLVTVKRELLKAVKFFDDFPPSIQRMANIRVVEAAHKYIEQAEELLAAERAKTERWHKKAMDAGVIVHSDGTTSHPMRKELDDLKADNAAQAARIKAETELREDHQQRNKELEAKLAAAENALEPFAKELSERHDKIFRLEPAPDSECVGFTQLTYGHFRKARAVLGGKPS